MQPARIDPPDDIDRLLARLEPAPPPRGFAARVLERTARRGQVAPWRARLATLAYLIALAALGMATYQAGQGLTLSGAVDLLQMALTDPELLAEEPAGFVLSVAELLPWWDLAVAAALAAAAVAAVRLAGRDWEQREDLGLG